MTDRVLVVGCGAIGGTLAGRLLQGPRGDRVEATTTNEAIAAAVGAQGFQLVGPDGREASVRGPCHTTLDPGARYGWILLAVQPPQVEEAARAVLPHLSPDGFMVCLQNGLCEAHVERVAGPGRVLGAVVTWGASMEGPGRFVQTSEGGFVVGAWSPRQDDAAERLAALLATVGPTDVAGDFPGVRWSKLAVNCAISTLGTLGGDRLGALLQHRFVRRLGLELITEVVELAEREGVRPAPLSGTLDLRWVTLAPEERRRMAAASLVAKHAVLLGVGARYRNLRSSMLAAIERGRPPAVDFLNGEVVQRAAAHGLAVPANAWCQRAVWEVARGERRPGLDTLRALSAELGLRT